MASMLEWKQLISHVFSCPLHVSMNTSITCMYTESNLLMETSSNDNSAKKKSRRVPTIIYKQFIMHDKRNNAHLGNWMAFGKSLNLHAANVRCHIDC